MLKLLLLLHGVFVSMSVCICCALLSQKINKHNPTIWLCSIAKGQNVTTEHGAKHRIVKSMPIRTSTEEDEL